MSDLPAYMPEVPTDLQVSPELPICTDSALQRCARYMAQIESGESSAMGVAVRRHGDGWCVGKADFAKGREATDADADGLFEDEEFAVPMEQLAQLVCQKHGWAREDVYVYAGEFDDGRVEVMIEPGEVIETGVS